MSARSVTAAEIRAAKSWLKKRKIELSPRMFATAAKKLDKSFIETLRIIASEQTVGQT